MFVSKSSHPNFVNFKDQVFQICLVLQMDMLQLHNVNSFNNIIIFGLAESQFQFLLQEECWALFFYN